MTTRFDLDRGGLTALLHDEPRYRVDQIWEGWYQHGKLATADLSNVPKKLRDRLDSELPPALDVIAESVSPDAATVKWLFGLPDGERLETVLMHYRDRSTVCVSTQVGCAMACGFCATGQAGFDRDLTVGEIVEQVLVARDRARPRRLSNVVFMGMGEPLANFDNTWGAVTRIHHDIGLSARHLTVSTVGVVPGIRRLAHEELPVNLAVSLHAANDTLRDEMVPINRRYPLAELVESLQEYRSMHNRRLSFEWAMISGVNDRLQDAAELAGIARQVAAHVNLIPLNPTPGYATVGSHAAAIAKFVGRLEELNVNVTVRKNRGTEIDAACGQLRAAYRVREPRRRSATETPA